MAVIDKLSPVMSASSQRIKPFLANHASTFHVLEARVHPFLHLSESRIHLLNYLFLERTEHSSTRAVLAGMKSLFD